MLPESESLSKLLADAWIKTVGCKIDTHNGYASEGSKLDSTSPSSAAEVTENMMRLGSCEVDESLNVMLPRGYPPVRTMRPDRRVLIRLASFHASPSCRPSEPH